MRTSFAVLMLVGPGEAEPSRLQDVISSLFEVEPECRELVLIDDGMRCPPQQVQQWIPQGGLLTILKNPRNGVGDGWADGTTVGQAAGLKYLSGRNDLQFVLRLDTDSAVFAPFADRIAAFLQRHQGCGLIGTYKKFPNGEKRVKPGFMIERQTSPYKLSRFLARLMLETREPKLILTALRRRFLIRTAERNGYVIGDYVQGGGFALSGEMLHAASRHGLLDDPFLFFHSRLTDDLVMTLLCYALGFRALDYNSPDEVFAVINYGLPDSPEVLARRGYAIAHSVKGDARWPEPQAREIFAKYRSLAVSQSRA